MPPVEARDMALGRYMDTFSRLEGRMKLVVKEVLKLDPITANSIAATLMTKQIIDLLEACVKLNFPDHSGRITKICKRLSKRNMRRNHIIHGRWEFVWTVDSDGNNDAYWIRNYNHINPDIENLTHDDPKRLGIYTFTIQELDKASGHVQEMNEALSALAAELQLPSAQW